MGPPKWCSEISWETYHWFFYQLHHCFRARAKQHGTVLILQCWEGNLWSHILCLEDPELLGFTPVLAMCKVCIKPNTWAISKVLLISKFQILIVSHLWMSIGQSYLRVKRSPLYLVYVPSTPNSSFSCINEVCKTHLSGFDQLAWDQILTSTEIRTL